MTANHVFYIPAILLLGLFVGAWWGRRQVYAELAEAERAERDRERRRAERRAKRQGGADDDEGANDRVERGETEAPR